MATGALGLHGVLAVSLVEAALSFATGFATTQHLPVEDQLARDLTLSRPFVLLTLALQPQ